MPKNIKINYLYRDAGNYKLFGSKCFANTAGLYISAVQNILEQSLEEGLYFIPEKWGFPRLSFEEASPGLDHEWHELESLEHTEEKAEEDLKSFLRKLKVS